MKKYTEVEIERLRDKALRSLDDYITALSQGDEHQQKSAGNLAKWVMRFVQYLKQEDRFDPAWNIKYERGAIVKVELGYNVGNEEGGVHYAVVMDIHNAKRSGVITVIPLSSKKDDKPVHPDNLDLGQELYDLLKDKLQSKAEQVLSSLVNDPQTRSEEGIIKINPDMFADGSPEAKSLNELSRLLGEVARMKKGSVALTSQIRAISKQRIIDPTKAGDPLSGIKLSDKSMDMLDAKVRDLYTKT